MQEAGKKNWIMVSFPHEFDHHIADQLVYEAVMESGLPRIGIEPMGEFDDDNPVFFLEFESYGPKRDWVMNTLSKHAFVQGVSGVSSIPPAPTVERNSTVPPPPAGPRSLPPLTPLSSFLANETTQKIPLEAVNDTPVNEPTSSLLCRVLETIGFIVAVESIGLGVGFLFSQRLDSGVTLATVSLVSIISGVGFFFRRII